MQDRCTRPVVSAYAAWHQMVPICTEWWCTEANEATQTHCYNPVAPAYPIWAYYAHGRQRRCQEDPVSLPSGRLEKTTRLSPHHVAQHRPTGSETTPPYAPRSSRFGSEPPSLEDDVDVWCYAIVSCMPETTTTTLDGVTIPLQFFHIISLFAQKEHPQLIMSQQETMGKMASVYSLQSPR